jgi:hypothetical protein
MTRAQQAAVMGEAGESFSAWERHRFVDADAASVWVPFLAILDDAVKGWKTAAEGEWSAIADYPCKPCRQGVVSLDLPGGGSPPILFCINNWPFWGA